MTRGKMMTVPSEWDRLRAFDGSVENAFEELCAQLARQESIAAGRRFQRNGKPDGGLECYATRDDGSIIGWQAKWFRSPPTSAQWGDITLSFERAIATYPALTEFVVCLPQDRATVGGGRKFTRERWDEHVAEWRAHALRGGRTVGITYWGTSELFDRLSQPDNRGRLRFWFDREFLGPAWFRQRFEEVWQNNRSRYRPDLNVDLPSVWWFDPLLQTPQYVRRLRQEIGRMCAAIDEFARWAGVAEVEEAIEALYARARRLRSITEALPKAGEGRIPSRAIEDELNAIRALYEGPLAATPASLKATEGRDWSRAHFGLYEAGQELEEYCHGTDADINESRALLILGEAGKGKTHSLFRIADVRTRAGIPAVVSCGIDYARGNPWAQMINGFGLTCDRDEFLGALDAAAEAAAERGLIIIDALNESDDPAAWKRSLPGILTAVRRYPSLTVALSTRGEFADTVVPDQISESELVCVAHRGFEGREEVATAQIFGHFGLIVPDVPLLDPEFANPLFVVTLADSLSRAGHKTLPPGARHLRWVFDLWLNGVNQRAAELLDFDPREERVQRGAIALATAMSECGVRVLSAEQAKALLEAVHPAVSWSHSLLRTMVHEDVIQRFQRYDAERDDVVDCVTFTFDRFADHLIARAILAAAPDAAKLRAALATGRLRRRVVHKQGSQQTARPGLLRALAIELPEDPRFQCELSDVLTGKTLTQQVEDAVVDSVRWRDPASISATAAEMVRRRLCASRDATLAIQRKVLEDLLQVAVRHDHPLNASFLDAELRRDPMPQRDFWWSRVLTQMGRDDGVVMRLVDWMAAASTRQAPEETLRLGCTCLAWFFSTSNRFIRDRATKACVSALLERPRLVADLVHRFIDVDDPYVVERVLAVAYGVALRTSNTAELLLLGRTVYDTCFLGGQLPVHLLARDYARGVVECTNRRTGAQLDDAVTNPPYTSEWPASISVHEDWDQRMGDDGWKRESGLSQVWHSVKDGDFGRYVIGTNSGQYDWLRVPLREDVPQLLKDPDPRGQPLGLLEDLMEDRRGGDARLEEAEPDYTTPGVPSSLASSDTSLNRTRMKWRAFFPVYQIQCMVMDDVIAMGYESRLDDGVESIGSDGGYADWMGAKSERIGKKYQWIAYWRTQARIADRFHFNGGTEIKEGAKYEGPWQMIGARDIDPSCLLRKKLSGHHDRDVPSWWAPFSWADFDRICSDEEWLHDTSRVPPLDELSEVVSPDGRQWLVGNLLTHLRQDVDPNLAETGARERHIWYRTVGVLVRAADSRTLVAWLNRERQRASANGHGLLPDRPHLHECFLGEFPTSAAWRAENIPWYGRDAWSSNADPPVACALLADGYFEDDHLDCGRDEVLEFCLPSAELVDGLGLRHGARDGHFEDADGRLIAWDPSITQHGPSALLIDRDAIRSYAAKRGYHIVQFIYGEQRASPTKWTEREYIGQLLFSGVLLWNGGRWKGALDARFDPPL